MKYRWLSPYNVTEADLKKSIFKLTELDGVDLEGTFTNRKLKKFVKNSNNNQKTPKRGPLYEEKKLDTSGEELNQGEQTPLGVIIRGDGKRYLGGSGD